MKKYIQKVADKNALSVHDVTIQDGYIMGEVIDKLARFESFYEELEKNQIDVSMQLEELRNEGKEKTVQYRELFTKKLVNNNVMAFLRFHGLAEKK